MELLTRIFRSRKKIINKSSIEEIKKPEKSEEYKPVTLQERLDIYKEMTRRIRNGEKETGYTFNLQSRGNITFEYNEVANHLVVERYCRGMWANNIIVSVFEKGQEQEAKDYCYKKIISYVKKEAHFKYGEFWHNSSFPYKHENGNISIVNCFPTKLFPEKTQEQERRQKWYLSSEDTKEKFNKLRVKHGLSPLEERI